MISLLYSLGMHLFSFALLLASPFNEKARLLRRGRREVWNQLARYVNSSKCVWIHAASLGEFEQGRPLIEAIRAKYPERKIVLTFFSPSGYEVRKNYALADLVCYMPGDTFFNAKRFIRLINPEMAFFVKYEFWHFHLHELKRKNIPVYGVSVIFRHDQQFFKFWGFWPRKALRCFTHFYLQDKKSAELLDSIKITCHTVAGDTRFDRVAEIAASSPEDNIAMRFAKNARVIVAGSSWQPDEDLLINYINNSPEDMKMILVPHEIDDEHIKEITLKIEVPYFLYKNATANPEHFKVMVVNTIGLLSAIYKYGQIAYIGGGFGKGIHNTLEAATYGMPVLWGPNYRKFNEAKELVERGAGYVITSQEELNSTLNSLWNDNDKLIQAGINAKKYVDSMCGATAMIMRDLF